jgi:hypothetical protein
LRLASKTSLEKQQGKTRNYGKQLGRSHQLLTSLSTTIKLPYKGKIGEKIKKVIVVRQIIKTARRTMCRELIFLEDIEKKVQEVLPTPVDTGPLRQPDRPKSPITQPNRLGSQTTRLPA